MACGVSSKGGLNKSCPLYGDAKAHAWRMSDRKLLKSMQFPADYSETILTPKSSRAVEAEWSYVAHSTGRSLVLPDGRCDLIFRDRVDGTGQPQIVITGPATHPYWVTFSAGDRWRGIRLRPENGRGLWQDALPHAADRVLRGADALARAPNAAIFATGNVPDFPTGHIDTRVTEAIDTIHTSGGRLTGSKLSAAFHLSYRHLNRLFCAHVGLSLKTYAQLVQFHRGLNLMTRNALSIADAVFETGYADHAHMTRSFQRFGGFPPSRIPSDLLVPQLFPG